MERIGKALWAPLLLLLAAAASAHHSWRLYDFEHKIVLQGTIKSFKLSNPHSSIQLAVAGKGGKTVVWDLLGPPKTALAHEGWPPRPLNAGDTLKADVAPLRSGAPGAAWRRAADLTLAAETPGPK